MIAVLDKNTQKIHLFKEKKACSEFVGISIRTFYRKIENTVFEVGSYTVYSIVVLPTKSKRGGKH